MKKTIKVKFVGFQSKRYINGVKLEKTWLYKTLTKNFNVVECDDADYIICSCFDLYNYCETNQIRIMFSGENYVPDFNLIDYAVSSYPIQFGDRNFFLPASLWGYDGIRSSLENRHNCFNTETLLNKTNFANLIASYDSENNMRSKLFMELSKYKQIDSPGKLFNNCDFQVRFQDNSKIDFQKKCKFSLCIESAINRGFNTEKITDAFYAETIPIYYGDPDISSIFNPKAFINIADFDTIEDAVNHIIRVDNDDNLYLEMLNEPVFVNPNFITDTFNNAESYLINIFNQPLEVAKRRSTVSWPLGHEEFLIKANKTHKILYKNPLYLFFKNILRKIR